MNCSSTSSFRVSSYVLNIYLAKKGRGLSSILLTQNKPGAIRRKKLDDGTVVEKDEDFMISKIIDQNEQ